MTDKLIEAINADKIQIVELDNAKGRVTDLKIMRNIYACGAVLGTAFFLWLRYRDNVEIDIDAFLMLSFLIPAVVAEIMLRRIKGNFQEGTYYLEERRTSKQLLNEIERGEL